MSGISSVNVCKTDNVSLAYKDTFVTVTIETSINEKKQLQDDFHKF